MSAQTAADLRAAAEVLERDGWGQHSYLGADGCRCVMGALANAITRGAYDGPYWRLADGDEARDFWARQTAANGALGDFVGNTVTFDWNDQPGRTAAEVIAALRAAADAADSPATCRHGYAHITTQPCPTNHTEA